MIKLILQLLLWKKLIKILNNNNQVEKVKQNGTKNNI